MTLQTLATIVGILTAIASGIYILIKDLRKVQQKYRLKLQGNWTNEGDITSIGKETHYCDLQFSTDIEDGEITGVISCRNLKKDFAVNNTSINGNLKFRSGTVRLSDVKRGELLKYGKARITLDGKLLRWKLLDGSTDYFPKSTTFWLNN